MAITGIQLRCGTDKTKSITVPAPVGGVVAGAMYVVSGLIGVAHETALVGVAVALCIAAHKILLPKIACTGGPVFAQGDKLYFTSGDAGVTTSGGSGVVCGRCLVASGAMDNTVLADFNGDVAA